MHVNTVRSFVLRFEYCFMSSIYLMLDILFINSNFILVGIEPMLHMFNVIIAFFDLMVSKKI